MVQRVTEKMLQGQVDCINELRKMPKQPYVNGVAQVGCYCLSSAYGGHALHQIQSEGGAVRDVLRCGHIPKRDLFERLVAYKYGVEDES